MPDNKRFFMPSENWPEAHQYNDLESLWVYETEMDDDIVVAVTQCQVVSRKFMVRVPVGDGEHEYDLFDTREEAERMTKAMTDA